MVTVGKLHPKLQPRTAIKISHLLEVDEVFTLCGQLGTQMVSDRVSAEIEDTRPLEAGTGLNTRISQECRHHQGRARVSTGGNGRDRRIPLDVPQLGDWGDWKLFPT